MQTHDLFMATVRRIGKTISLVAGGLVFMTAPELAAESAQSRLWATELLNRVEQHPALLSGREQVYRAGQDAIAASQPLYNPEIEFSWSKKEKFDPDENYQATIRQTVDWAGKREARAKVAELNDDARQAGQRALKQRLLAEGVAAAIEAYCAERLHQNAMQQQETLLKLAEMLDQRRRLGESTRVEVDFGYLALAGELDAVTDIEQRLNRARLQLNNALPGAEQGRQPPTELLQPLDGQLPEDLLDSLPSVQAARRAYDSARVAIESARRDARADPTLGLVGGKDDDDKYIGLSLSIPLRIRNDYSATVLSAGYQANTLEQQYLDTRRKAENRLMAARSNYQQLLKRWRRWQSLTFQRLEGAGQLLERLWLSGELRTRDYIAELTQRRNTRASGYEMEADLWRSWVEWMAATGQLESWLKETSQP